MRWIDIGLAMDDRTSIQTNWVNTQTQDVQPRGPNATWRTHGYLPAGATRDCRFCGKPYTPRPGKGCPECHGKGHQ